MFSNGWTDKQIDGHGNIDSAVDADSAMYSLWRLQRRVLPVAYLFGQHKFIIPFYPLGSGYKMEVPDKGKKYNTWLPLSSSP